MWYFVSIWLHYTPHLSVETHILNYEKMRHMKRDKDTDDTVVLNKIPDDTWNLYSCSLLLQTWNLTSLQTEGPALASLPSSMMSSAVSSPTAFLNKYANKSQPHMMPRGPICAGPYHKQQITITRVLYTDWDPRKGWMMLLRTIISL